MDVTDLRRADPLLLMLAARGGVPLYEREPGEFGRFASLAARRYADTRKLAAITRSLDLLGAVEGLSLLHLLRAAAGAPAERRLGQ